MYVYVHYVRREREVGEGAERQEGERHFECGCEGVCILFV